MTRTLILTRYEFEMRSELAPDTMPVIEAAYLQHLRDCNISSEAEDCGRAWKLGFAAQNGIEVVEFKVPRKPPEVPTPEEARKMIRVGQSIGVYLSPEEQRRLDQPIKTKRYFPPRPMPVVPTQRIETPAAIAVASRPETNRERRDRMPLRPKKRAKPKRLDSWATADALRFRVSLDDDLCESMIFDEDDSQRYQLEAIEASSGGQFLGRQYRYVGRERPSRKTQGQFVNFSFA